MDLESRQAGMPVLPMQRKRIAIYGGTFDPVHSGHLEIARRVTQLFGIGEFLFVPAMVAPHKMDREVSGALHRYAMLALATREDPRLSISSFELDGPGRQFTVDTLLHFRSLLPESADLFFVMGADSWAEFTTWREMATAAVAGQFDCGDAARLRHLPSAGERRTRSEHG